MVADERCYLCQRLTLGDSVLLDYGPHRQVVAICSICWEKRDDVSIPLDMTEDEEFENREGQPEFNGAFNAW